MNGKLNWIISLLLGLTFMLSILTYPTLAQLSENKSQKAIPISASDNSKAVSKNKAIKLGNPIDEKAMVSLKKLLKNPELYIEKVITITGTVTEGCHHSGKWVRISDGENSIDAFASDDWRFPTDHKGLKATVTGRFLSRKLTGESLKAYIEHQNSEHNGHLKEKDYPDGLTVYRIEALGCTLE